MPLYEYRCKACGTTREARHGFKESFSEPCAACGGELTRVFNAAGIVFKGSGFYKTDSRASKSDTSGGASEKSASETTPAKPAESTSDKPAAEKTAAEKPKPSGGKGDAAA